MSVRCFVLLPVFALISCAAARKAAIHPGTISPTEDERAAGAVTLLREEITHFHPDKNGKAITETTFREQILFLETFAERPDELRAGYSRTFSPEPPTLRASVIAPDGKETEVDPKKKFDAPVVSSSVLYMDSRVVVLPLPAIVNGAVLDYEEHAVGSEPRLFQESFQFGGGLPTRKARWVIRHPSSWQVDVQFLKGRTPQTLQARVEQDGDDTVHTFELTNQPAALSEERGIWGHNLFVGSTRLSAWTELGKEQRAFATDEELAHFYAELNAGTDEANDAIRAEVAKIIAGATDPEEKARRLHAHVTTGVRYCAIELGLGGWRPHNASEVFDARAGDCKDKANLLKTMLRAAGIESRIAALYVHSGHPRALALPTLGTTNHAILIVDLPSGPVVVDPTAESVPYGELPAGDQGALLFPIAKANAKPFESPIAPPEKNAKEARLTAALEGGVVRGKLHVTATGMPASGLRGAISGATAAKREEVLQNWLPVRTSARRSVTVDGLKLPANAVTVAADVDADFLAGSGRTRVLRLSDAAALDWPAPTTDKRETPYALYYLPQDKTTIRLQLPAGATVRAPGAMTLESPYGQYAASYRYDGGVLEVTREAKLTRRVVPAEEFAAFRSFVEKVQSAENAPVIISLPTP